MACGSCSEMTFYVDIGRTFVAYLGKLSGNNFVPAVQADVATITYSVLGEDGVTPIDDDLEDEPLTPVSSYIYNTLQTGDLWADADGTPITDPTGFNFKASLPDDAFPDVLPKTTVEFLLKDSGGNLLWRLCYSGKVVKC